MKLRVHLATRDPTLRRRLTAIFRGDADVVLTGDPEQADVVVGEGIGAAAAGNGRSPAEPAEGETLTARELEVLRLIAEGLGNKRIARELAISTHTVKYHVASVLTKLGAHSRTEAVSRGLRRGLVPL